MENLIVPPFSIRIFLFDARLHAETLDILTVQAPGEWYAGEADPSFVQKIAELREHPLTTDMHRDQLQRLLPAYGKVDESVTLEDEDDEHCATQEKKSAKVLARLFKFGEISLAFAGPCILLEVSSTARNDADCDALSVELDTLRAALEANGGYVAVSAYPLVERLALDSVPSLLTNEWRRRVQSAERKARINRRDTWIFRGINAAIGLGSLFLLIYGVQQFRKLQAIDLSNQYTFVVHQKGNSNHRRLFPKFQATGVIRETNEAATLNLYRDEFASIQPTYEVPVLKTADLSEPYILALYVAKHSPFSIGRVKINSELLVWAICMAGWALLLYRYACADSDWKRESIRNGTRSVVGFVIVAIVGVLCVVWIGTLL